MKRQIIDEKALPKILFVCVANSCRSQMAEGLANLHGAGKMKAFSAGSHASGWVHPVAIDLMKEKGYDLTAHASKSVSQFEGVDMDVVVTMGCGDSCPLVPAKRRLDWKIPDPVSLPEEKARAVRDLIEDHVIELLGSL